ncbi:MAG: hypothetical protein KIT87_24895 [Anaerolineae bacterium]|nr:hypothetical protein [Anaerolineae bacterium]
MKKPFSADWRAITGNEDEEPFATKAETERVVREHTAGHEDVIALIYHNDRLKSIALWGQLFDIR